MPRPFSSQPYTDFFGQYEWAKEKFARALKNNENIVLYGKGRTGKSHLTQEHEFNDFFKNEKYVCTHMMDPKDARQYNNWCIDLKKKNIKFVAHIYDLDDLDKGLKFQDYVFINMNNYIYQENNN
tara:strand:+ start:9312 stop:9686 length:375 start_codon:yes stop_codon:yes gene_type:complete